MKTEITGRRKATVGEKIIGAFLIAGGLLGILAAVLIGLRFAKQNETLRVFIQIVSVSLFGWCIATGIALWRGFPGAVRMAQLLFALQVPAFTLARFSYEFSTFVSLRLMTGNTTHNIGGNIGSSFNLYRQPEPLGAMFGINIVAAIILVYLIRASRAGLVSNFEEDQSRSGTRRVAVPAGSVAERACTNV